MIENEVRTPYRSLTSIAVPQTAVTRPFLFMPFRVPAETPEKFALPCENRLQEPAMYSDASRRFWGEA